VNYLKWNLMIISPLNYTYALLTYGVVFSDDTFKYKSSLLKDTEGQMGDLQKTTKIVEISENKIKSVRKYCEFYTDMTLQSFD
jgi:hypothetical protein